MRPATTEDAQSIADIYNHAVLHTTATFDTVEQTAERRREWLADAKVRVALVAEEDGRVVGWGSLTRWSERCAYEGTVEISTYIAPDSQRRGYGTLLGEALLDEGRRLGVHAVISQVSAENEASLAMTARLGFDRVGVLREVGCKFGRVLDVVILEKLLSREG